MFRFLSFVLPVLALGTVALVLNSVARADGPTTGSVKFTVQDKSANAVAGAHVSIFAAKAPKSKPSGAIQFADELAKPVPVAEGDTAADGTLTLSNIPVGEYTAKATKDATKGSAKKFAIAAGDPVQITITVK